MNFLGLFGRTQKSAVGKVWEIAIVKMLTEVHRIKKLLNYPTDTWRPTVKIKRPKAICWWIVRLLISPWLKFLVITGLKPPQKKEKKKDNKLAIRLSKTCHTTYNVLIFWLTNNFILKECATHVKFKKWFSIGTVLVWNMINIKERSILEHTVCIFFTV